MLTLVALKGIINNEVDETSCGFGGGSFSFSFGGGRFLVGAMMKDENVREMKQGKKVKKKKNMPTI
jgi:hypothetical protein